MQTYTIPQGTKELTIQTYNDKIVIEFVPEKKKPIFTTEDGVNLYGKQDECWYARLCDNGIGKQPFVHEAMDSHSGFKYFSSQQAARQYVAEKKWEPKDGEICFVSNPRGKWIIIFDNKAKDNRTYYKSLCSIDGCDVRIRKDWGDFETIRPATPSEAQLLFDKLAEAGYRWNAEEKKVEKVRWMAEKGGNYWTIINGRIDSYRENKGVIDNRIYESGFYFRTRTQTEAAFEAVKNLLLNTEF